MLGLPHEEEDDDDSHLCIKCNTTINGLDNYVKHRKTVCSKENRERISQNHQGADVFFQSLNLQSSAKKPSIAVTAPPVVTKTSPGVLTRRSVAAIISGNKEIQPSTSSDLFLSQKRGEDWIGGQNIHVAETDDNHTKLIKAVASISGKVKKDYIQTDFVYNHDDDSNEASEDYDDFEEEDHIQTGGKWKTPIGSTGGKWKPQFSPRHDADNHDEWEDEHTGGKWKTFLSVDSFNRVKNADLQDMEEEEVDDYRPPPEHTRGKWIPGANSEYKLDHKTQIMDITSFHKEGGSFSLWCGPCNRKLSSRKNYEKHLESSLHLKKTLPEKDLEYAGVFKHEQVLGKREVKPSRYINESVYLVAKNKRKNQDEDKLSKNKRRRRKITCVVCKSNVKYSLMGKHLISHYHFRKADVTDVEYKQQILENIENIILQSPFQCSPCKFYCNWESELLKHWRSPEHKNTVDIIEGKFWCSMCKYEEENPELFEKHLCGKDHRDFVAAINRSMPVIIRKMSILKCDVCNEQFKYNIQLDRHIKKKCQSSLQSTASDEYQGKMKCNICFHSFKSLVSLSRHMNTSHDLKKYICTNCNEEFPTSQEAKAHRQTQKHQINKLENMVKEGLLKKDLSKSCPHCDAPRFQNIIILKRHIENEHQNQFYSCFRCGMKFPLRQEVTWHIRNAQCNYNNSSSEKYKWTCNFCPFVTDSASDCWYHNLILHDESKLITHIDENHSLKYACPMCPKSFKKDYFRIHLKTHTGEREFKCSHCPSRFLRKSSLKHHVKQTHSDPLKATTTIAGQEAVTNTGKRFLCSFCGAEFTKKFSLKQHLFIHLGRTMTCQVEGCEYTGRTASDVRLHMKTHNEDRPYICSYCDYSSKTKSQLGKHMKCHEKDREMKFCCPLCSFKSDVKCRLDKHSLLHTDNMPYKCPYCPFTCKSMENLRKHVLSRNKHSGKFMYVCPHCDTFQTNYSKDFKIHLTKFHLEIFENTQHINEFVSNYLNNIT